MTRRLLAFYGWLFALAGAAFVLAEPLVLAALSWGARLIPGARPLPAQGPSLWLGLTGSLMAVLSFLAFSLSRDPDQPSVWQALLLSKGVSAGLFCVFAARSGNPAFLAAAAVDAAILVHLRLLRPAGYEVWFLKLNDPRTGSALWLRETQSLRGAARVSSRWYVWFDAVGRRVLKGRWDEPSGGAAVSPLAAGRMTARGPGVEWDVRWAKGEAPAFEFVPRPLAALGLASSRYEAPVPAGRFSGRLALEGQEFVFEGAPGSIGHLWGRAMAAEWRWAHAAFAREGAPYAVVEVLSARVEAAGVPLPWLTAANLWLDGRLHRCSGVWRGLRSASSREGDVWRFSLDFGGLRAEGECSPAPGMTAELVYESPDGRRLLCRNSKTGALRLKLLDDGGPRGELCARGCAAVEFAGPAS